MGLHRKQKEGAAAAVASPAPSTGSAAEQSWGCGGVRWGQVFQYQTHGGWIVLLAAAIIVAISHYSITPDYRPLTTYDAAVALPNHPDTVPIIWAGIIPAVALLLTAAAVEFGALYKRQSLTMAVHAFCHIVWWAIIGFAVVLAITEATKPWASRYRPDYMSRCKPLNVEGKPLSIYQRTDCDPNVKQSDFVKDGRKSFPSGHSSNSMSLCWFTVLYFVHALYWRDGFRFMGSVWGSSSCGRRFLGECLQGLFIVWGLAVLTIAWCVGVTRFRDNRHNIDDILGGFVAALLWMTPCVFIALGQLNYFQRQLRKQEEGDVLPIVAPAAGSSAPAAGYSNSKEPTAAPAAVAAPVLSGSAGSAAAAADAPSAPPRLQSLESAREPAVVPVADTNGVR